MAWRLQQILEAVDVLLAQSSAVEIEEVGDGLLCEVWTWCRLFGDLSALPARVTTPQEEHESHEYRQTSQDEPAASNRWATGEKGEGISRYPHDSISMLSTMSVKIVCYHRRWCQGIRLSRQH